jgi:hypothetical protein
MSKLSQYFDSIEALEAYYVNGVPSKVLAYVKDEEDNYILYTATNNVSDGEFTEMGGYVMSPEDKKKMEDLEAEVEDAEEISDEIIDGPIE